MVRPGFTLERTDSGYLSMVRAASSLSTSIILTLGADWIPTYLQVETQLALRVEMEKARSMSDVPGYIYAYEIRGIAGHTHCDCHDVNLLQQTQQLQAPSNSKWAEQ